MEANTLIEDYKRKLQAATDMMNNLRFKDNANPHYIRLSAKASCYRTIISDLERELADIYSIK